MHPLRSKTGSGIDLTDIFCGCGGSSTGAVGAGLDVRMALNHWDLAVETHNTNHPDTDHDCTDVSACRPDRYPRTRILWASPECTNHSLAKGTKYKSAQLDAFDPSEPDPAAERSRATMWDVPRFAEWHDYELVIVENVVDARRWRMWPAWIKAMRCLGYEHECVYLNSMFCLPTPQSRDRLYVVFWKRGNPKPDLDIRPPAHCPACEQQTASVQSWCDTPLGRKRVGKYQQQYDYRCPDCAEVVRPYYYAAFNVIDWSIEAPRIGERDRPLAEKTMERIRYGLERYGREPLVITTRYTSGVGCRVRRAMADEMPTQPGDASHALLSPYFVDTAYPDGTATRTNGAGEALRTQTGRRTVAIIHPGFLSKQYTTFAAAGMGDSTGTVTTSDHHGVVRMPMLTSVNYFDDRNVAALEAYPTQTTQTKWGLTLPPAFIAELYGTSKAKAISERLGCVTAGGINHALIDTRAFLRYYYGNARESSLKDPLGTVTTVDRAALVEAAENVDAEDCTFRMLQPHEIRRAMAFPDSYDILGTKRDQVKQLGNAVTPPAARVLLERCVETLS